MQKSTWKGMLTGFGGGMVAAWAVGRFYEITKKNLRGHALTPYAIGAGVGAAYGAFVLSRNAPLIARVPLGAALYLGDPEHTAAPPKGGRGVVEKAGNLTMRLASRALKKAAEQALVA